ncbi:hypothetical protein AB0B31_22455 [Catellatospora citrea]|uniref:hypothetical protein n=1 Tax=Catellatospora citrea TaxID=53366 RepID=UPI0033C2F8EA
MNDFLRSGLADLAAQAAPADLYSRVLTGSRRRSRRRAVAALAAVTVLTGATVTGAVLFGDQLLPPPVTTPTSTPATPPVPTPTGSRAPSPAVSPSSVTPQVDVRNATFDVPELGFCSASRRTFVDGLERDAVRNQMRVLELSPPGRADLDGVPGDEVVVLIGCQLEGPWYDTQVLALTVGADGALRPLGCVVDAATDAFGPWIEPTDLRVRGDEVVLRIRGYGWDDGAEWIAPQERGFAYRDGAFVQVSGPTARPSPLPR